MCREQFARSAEAVARRVTVPNLCCGRVTDPSLQREERELTLHIDENKIEQFVLEPDVFNDAERSEILTHINSCSVCKEIYDTYSNIYVDLAAGIDRPGTSNDEEIAKRIYQRLNNSEERKLLSEKAATVQVYDGKTEIVERPKLFSLSNFYYFIKTYPIPSLGFAIIGALALAFIVGQSKSYFKDNNPYSLDVKENKILVYNKEGDLLWTKSSTGLPKYDLVTLINWTFGKRRYLSLQDIDSNGKKALLVTGEYSMYGFYKSDSIYCFNSDGSLRWVISPEDAKHNYAPTWKRTRWGVRDFFTVKTKTGNKLYVIANDDSYAGTVVSQVDPKTGKILSSIYHSGWITAENHFDIDGDGNEEIILGGTSSFDKPSFMVLKSNNSLKGVMPDLYHTQKNPVKGNAEYYLLLKVSDLGKLLSESGVNDVCELRQFEKSGIELITREVVANEYRNYYNGLVYSFDDHLKVKHITASAAFAKSYSDLYKKGKLNVPLDSIYFNTLKDSVLYWDGDKFVNYPTKNKYWDR